MSRVPQKATSAEERVARVLRQLGMSYRRNVRALPGSPDFANKSRRWAVQVHGCFWHRHDCKRATLPLHNREFWVEKFARNQARDARCEAELRALGFKVVTVWECETKDDQTMADALRRNLG